MTDLLRSPVECIVEVDDDEITSLYPYLREATVEMTRKAAAAATLVFDTFRDERGDWQAQDSGILKPWKSIRIVAVFGSTEEEVFRGYIKEVKADYPPDMSAAKVTVTAQDESIVFDREQVKKTWSQETEGRNVSDGYIVRQIIGDEFELDVKDGLDNLSVNCDATEIKFLRDRAAANGFELLVREGKLYFGPSQLSGTAQHTILVYAGPDTNCLSFSTHFDGHKPDMVRVVRADEKGNEKVEETVRSNLTLLGTDHVTSDDAGLGDFVWNIERPSGGSQAEAKARAQAAANEADWKLMAEGELDGAVYGHVLLSHRTVLVDGVGDTYGGLYYVDEVRHVFNPDGYRQAFKLVRNATGYSSDLLGQAESAIGGLLSMVL